VAGDAIESEVAITAIVSWEIWLLILHPMMVNTSKPTAENSIAFSFKFDRFIFSPG
jgi:hypothetical protein